MNLIIHRGAKEIGGSCVEIQSKQARIIIDLGMPLVNELNDPFDSKSIEDKETPDLIQSHVLPDVRGLYAGGEKSVDAIFISHPHQDHYGLLRYINPEIPIFMTRGAKALIDVSDIFIPTKANLHNVNILESWRPLKILDLNITPYLVDHSAFDATALLIESEGKKIFYSGDFRGHGRKKILFNNMLAHPISDIDYMLLEGSMIGREDNLYQDETAVENKMADKFRDKSNIAFVFCSSQNIDRLVSVYRASKRSRQTFVIDLYTAFILHSLRDISDKLPQYSWQDVRVVYFRYHAECLANSGHRQFLLDCAPHKIEKEDIVNGKKNIVMIAKDSHDFKRLFSHIVDFEGIQAVYSMWDGYLERSSLPDLLELKGVKLEKVHTSGHAVEDDLKKLVSAFKPRNVIPIHTFQPQSYVSLFPNVLMLKDGEVLTV